MAELESIVHHEDERLRLVRTGPMMLVHIRRRFTLTDMQRIYEAQVALRDALGRHAVVVVVGDLRTEWSDATRELSRQTTEEFAEWVTCVAHVVEARGFAGAAVRCVMAGMRVISRPPYPIREFATVRGAAMWMAPLIRQAELELPMPATPGALLEWIELARAPDLLDSGGARLS